MSLKAGFQELDRGLWIWRARHPYWSKDDDYPQVVTSTYVETESEVIVIGPIAPSLDCIDLWGHLDSKPPTTGG